jgi:diguanylate cyclase (GGDEF)-like protein
LFSGVNVDPRHQEKYFLAGGSDYFIKPFLKGIVVPRFKIHLELKQTRERLEAANQKLANLAKTDGLTGISNRREFDDFLVKKWPIFAGMKKAISLILCDVDYFKKYNDTYGHQAGDDCLKKIASAINGITSHEHLAARYGGEELAVVMPGVEIDEAQSFAHQIMKQIHKLELAHEKSDVSEYVTLSIGVFCVIPSQTNTVTILVSGADEALYEAKNTGRDRIIAKDENAKAP